MSKPLFYKGGQVKNAYSEKAGGQSSLQSRFEVKLHLSKILHILALRLGFDLDTLQGH